MDRRFLLSALLCAVTLAPLAPAADTWKVAPPPPASWKRDRLGDLAARRKAVADQIGEKGILILYAAEPRNYAGDVDWPYRQENDFFYLTGISQEGCALVMIPGAEQDSRNPLHAALESLAGELDRPHPDRRRGPGNLRHRDHLGCAPARLVSRDPAAPGQDRVRGAGGTRRTRRRPRRSAAARSAHSGGRRRASLRIRSGRSAAGNRRFSCC